ncbi:MAG: type I restriction-modification system subunit M N-terminal domain-containing protein [Elusimicrobiota bacterium]|jgi:type I restriction enzyme M protein|nr:type I restriction-modification system subunit M N-terminal domain-containing protein [Elusimicrobiota bacterium]
MSLSANVNEKANLIWAIADKLTGVYKPHEYGEVILPLMVIRRFDCILQKTKNRVLQENNKHKKLSLATRFGRNI